MLFLIRHWKLIIVIVTVFMGPQGLNTAKAETIVLAADLWCPYNCEPDSTMPGYMVEIAKTAFAKHGIDVEYKLMPWARAIEDAKANKHTGIIGAYYSDAPDFIYPEEHQGQCLNAFFVRPDDPWEYKGIGSLENKSLGVIGDYSYSQEIDTYIEENKHNTARIQNVFGDFATRNNVRKLILGRVDVIIEDVQVMDYFLGKDELADARGKIRNAGIVPDEEDDNGIIFIAFSPINPDSQRYARILSDETKAMRQNGELQAILKRYGIKNFDGGPENAVE